MVINEVTVLVWIVCGIGSFLITQNRGAANAATWFLVGILLGPLGILLAAIGAKGDSAATSRSSIGTADELSKLAALRDQGTITDAEFTRQKAGLLAQPASQRAPALTGSRRNVYLAIVVLLLLALVWLLANMH